MQPAGRDEGNAQHGDPVVQAYVDDATADANAARPITAGGTGANNATDARESLGANNASNLTKGTVDDARLPATQSGKTFTSTVTVTKSDAGDYVSLTPVGCGAGKPMLAINKAAEEDKWNVTLWDGTAVAGQINVNAGTFTFNNQTIWHAGNDGVGSGLDADLLDGRHAADFVLTSSYTAADVLAQLKTVDGSGSGLDADVLRGQALTPNPDPWTVVGRNGSGGASFGAVYAVDYIEAGGPLKTESGIVQINSAGNSHLWYKLNGVNRVLLYWDGGDASLNMNLYDATGTFVRTLKYRQSDGMLDVSGYVRSHGRVYVGTGGTYVETDGNVTFTGGMTALGANLYEALGRKAGIYMGGNERETDYPVGHTVLAYTNGWTYHVNSSGSPTLSNNEWKYYRMSGVGDPAAGTPLAGAWRARGHVDNNWAMFQRVS